MEEEFKAEVLKRLDNVEASTHPPDSWKIFRQKQHRAFSGKYNPLTIILFTEWLAKIIVYYTKKIKLFELIATWTLVFGVFNYLLSADSRRNSEIFLASQAISSQGPTTEGSFRRLALLKLLDLGVSLKDVDLSNWNLENAKLNGRDLSGVILNNANLECAYLESANLSGAKLINANLNCTKLSKANLWQADLTNASIWYIELYKAELRQVKNLDIAGLVYANGDSHTRLPDYAKYPDGWLNSTELKRKNSCNYIFRPYVFDSLQCEGERFFADPSTLRINN